MKCKDCSAAVKGFFNCYPDKHVCIGVKEPFVINDISVECTEYPEHMQPRSVTAKIDKTETLAEPYVDNEGIYVPSDIDPRFHKLVISRELFVEAYNKWIKNDGFDPFVGQDTADDWCE